jgi:hypothetical protein
MEIVKYKCTTKLLLSEEASPLTRPFFHCRRDNLIKGEITLMGWVIDVQHSFKQCSLAVCVVGAEHLKETIY